MEGAPSKPSSIARFYSFTMQPTIHLPQSVLPEVGLDMVDMLINYEHITIWL
jgi:hypothetical protein